MTGPDYEQALQTGSAHCQCEWAHRSTTRRHHPSQRHSSMPQMVSSKSQFDSQAGIFLAKEESARVITIIRGQRQILNVATGTKCLVSCASSFVTLSSDTTKMTEVDPVSSGDDVQLDLLTTKTAQSDALNIN